MSEKLIIFFRDEKRKHFRMKMFEIILYISQILTRLYCFTNTSFESQIFWYNISMLNFKTNIFNVFITKLLFYGILSDIEFYIRKNESLMIFVRNIFSVTPRV